MRSLAVVFAFLAKAHKRDARCAATGTIWIPSPPGAKAVTVTAAAALLLVLLGAFV